MVMVHHLDARFLGLPSILSIYNNNQLLVFAVVLSVGSDLLPSASRSTCSTLLLCIKTKGRVDSSVEQIRSFLLFILSFSKPLPSMRGTKVNSHSSFYSSGEAYDGLVWK
jgi:hypothetical protein